jgi:hypothetical protein
MMGWDTNWSQENVWRDLAGQPPVDPYGYPQLVAGVDFGVGGRAVVSWAAVERNGTIRILSNEEIDEMFRASQQRSELRRDQPGRWWPIAVVVVLVIFVAYIIGSSGGI